MLNSQTVRVPLVALRDSVLMPNTKTSLSVGREKSINAINRALETEDKLIFLVSQLDSKTENPTSEQLNQIGVVAKILRATKSLSQIIELSLEIQDKAAIDYVVSDEESMEAVVSIIPPTKVLPSEETEIKVLKQSLKDAYNALYLETRSSYASFNDIKSEKNYTVKEAESNEEVLYRVLDAINVSTDFKQEILEMNNIKEQLFKVVNKVEEIRVPLEMEKKIKQTIDDNVTKSQKEYYLRERMDALNKELADEEGDDISELQKKIEAKFLHEDGIKTVKKEIKRLRSLTPMQAEYGVIRNFLENISELPWGKLTSEKVDVLKTKEHLDADHYGMEKVKERILEHIAVLQYNPDTSSPVLCLAGAPGVGKTSVAKSIASSMGREFVKVSLGGVRDEAEIRGHRRTYIGAMVGRIIGAIKKAGTDDPVILLDEIDKMTLDQRGDPAAALLEVLDPSQNTAFRDHFLDLEYDLSKVIFIATANYVNQIPGPLLDRMELINVDSYLEEEKVAIAKNHLVPKAIKNYGINIPVTISDEVLLDLVRGYTGEAGVRNLERKVNTIFRKIIKEIVSKENTSGFAVVESEDLEKYLGPKRYDFGRIEKKDEVGLVNGMAYSQVGGDLLQLEVVVMPGTGRVVTSGSLGEVMTESAGLALTYVKSKYKELGISPTFFNKKDIHIHFPDGSTPKDGPSAGITMVTGIVSAVKGKKVKNTVSMTGEVSIRGKVLPIGGLREKITSAVRGGIKTVIIPKSNEKDLHDVPEKVLKGLKVIAVDDVMEVLKHALVGGLK